MSFAVWFILLCVISLGIGALVEPWLESRLFRVAFLPGILLSGICRLLGGRIAGLPVPERRLFSGTGRGVRVDTSGAPWPRILLLSVISFCGPLLVVVLANALSGWPLRLDSALPGARIGRAALFDVPSQAGVYLLDVWDLLGVMAAKKPVLLLWAYLFVGVLLSNSPAKRESGPLWVAAIFIGLLVAVGFVVRVGSKADKVFDLAWMGLSLSFAFSLLTLVIAIGLAAIYRARSNADSSK